MCDVCVEVWCGVTVWMSCVNEKGQRSEVDEREGDVCCVRMWMGDV